jgi:hypothetical protein
MKAFSSFSDLFTSGFKSGWKTIIPGWSSSSNTVIASTSSYPISSVKMSKENVTINIKEPGVGSGAALWVSDAGNWWTVVSKQEQCAGCGSCNSVNAYNPCGAGGNCIGTGGTCVGTGGGCVGTGGGTNAPSGGGTYCAYNSCGTSNPYYCNPVYYVPYSGFYTCSMYNPSGYCKYGFYTPGGATGPFGGYCSGGNCASTYTCNPNPVVPGNPIPYNPCGYTTPYNPCGYTNPYNPCGSTNPCVATGGTCNSYDNTYPRYIKILKYASNAISEMASITLDSLTSFPGLSGLKVIISNSSKSAGTATITAKAFSDSSMITQIGDTLVYNATGVNIVTNYGIIGVESQYNQNLSISEIEIS